MLELTNVSSGYSVVEVLHGVSLSLQRGERVALIGPNGAGKTTLLETIAGFVRVFSGSMSIDGRDIGALPTEKRAELGIALVTEKRNLFPEMTTAENLRMGRCAAPQAIRWRKADIEATTERVLNLFPKLRQLYHRPVGVMSGGEQQMVAIGRALMAEPKLLMLDEPSQGLAPRIVEAVYEAINGVAESMSVLLVEQDLQLVSNTTKNVHLIVNGHIRKLQPGELDDNEFMVREIFGSVR